MKKNVLVAAAWPYANTSLHLGHVAGLLGADILARYHRLAGNNVLFVSGSDCHGTPISIEADRLNVSPEDVAQRYHKEFVGNLVGRLGFSYDLYTTTMTANHAVVVQELFLKLHHDGLVYPREDNLPYCIRCKRFLSDRYVEGVCPHCDFTGARGDQCDECGKLLDPSELINPKCKVCGQTPEWRLSEHFYLKLSHFQQFLEKWVASSQGWRTNAVGFAKKLLREGLHDRPITRDTTWGVPIPLPGYDGKSIYVWFEAVCGYLSASKEWAASKNEPETWKKWWEDDKAIHYYIHGKDNIPFHTIIWPAMLQGLGGLHLPDRIISSEHLTLERKQFSKSRHWAVWLNDFLAEFDPETLRFYLVIAGPETADADFSWSEYKLRVNSELIGKLANFINRVLTFITKNFPEGAKYPKQLTAEQSAVIAQAEKCIGEVGQDLENGKFRPALKRILLLADDANRFIDTAKPWTTIKTERGEAESDLAVATQLVRCFSVLIEPFLPATSAKVWGQLGEDKPNSWKDPDPRPITQPKDPTPLFKRIDESEVKQQRERLSAGKTDTRPR